MMADAISTSKKEVPTELPTVASNIKIPTDDTLTRSALVFLTWMIPGAGFLVRGRPIRGVVLFALIMATFSLGLILRGCVEVPVWSPRSEGFNLVAILTFLVQLGAGLPSLVSLLAHQMKFGALAGDPADPFFDLATFYILVAGALNYFVVCNFYDRHYGEHGAGTLGTSGKKPAVADGKETR